MGALDYGYTCGEIDTALNNMEDRVFTEMKMLIEDISPRIPEQGVVDLAYEYSSDLGKYLTMTLELLRETNSGMRDAADKQIASLEEEKDSLEEDNRDLEQKVAELQKEVDLLEKEVGYLQDDLQDMEDRARAEAVDRTMAESQGYTT